MIEDRHDETAISTRADELVAEWLPWLKAEARIQAAKEARGFALLPFRLGDLPEPPEWFDRELENRYRRGYWHGYSAALDDVEPATTRPAWNKAARFFDGPLTAWRYADKASRDVPPNMPRAPR